MSDAPAPRTYVGSWFTREIRTAVPAPDDAAEIRRRYMDGTPAEPEPE